MLVLALVGVVTASAVAVTFGELVRVGRLEPHGADELVEALGANDTGAIEHAIESLFPDADSAFFHRAVSASSPSAAVAAIAQVNQRLGEVDHELSSGKDIPRSALRVALFSGTAGAVTEAASGLGRGYTGAWITALGAFGIGAFGAMICFELGRRGLARANARRIQWDRVGTAISRCIAPALESIEAGSLVSVPLRRAEVTRRPKRSRRRES